LQACRALNKNKYRAVPVYISRGGGFFTGDALLDIANFRDLPKLLGKVEQVVPIATNDGRLRLAPLSGQTNRFFAKDSAFIDVALPIVHGTNVEDGTLQGFLQTLGIPFVGCDVTASALGMDKYVQKLLFRDAGLLVLDGIRLTAGEYYSARDKSAAALEWKLPYPMIVKPLNLGSSIGVALAQDRVGLQLAIEEAFQFCTRILIEPAITSLREINCAVLGDYDTAQASECEEPKGGALLSYDDKYGSGSKAAKEQQGGMTNLKRLLPAPISKELRVKIRETAVTAFKALNCSGVARIDFLLDTATANIFVNEINTIPGSLSFYLWEPLGMSYTELLEELIALAFKRYREDQSVHYDIETNILSAFAGGGKRSKL
jgi:D-alanine-D-alanine ligase